MKSSQKSATPLAGAAWFALDWVLVTVERPLVGSYRRLSDIASKNPANWRNGRLLECCAEGVDLLPAGGLREPGRFEGIK